MEGGRRGARDGVAVRCGRGRGALFALVALGLLAQGCAATRLQPTRRLEAGETVVTGAFNAPSLIGVSRLGVGAMHGLGDVDLLLDAGLGSAGLEGGVGLRAYLGGLNASIRAGVSVSEWTPYYHDGTWDVAPAWDARLTSRSRADLPWYIGAQTSGVFFDGDVRAYAGGLVGYEWWGRGVGVQAELGISPLWLGEDPTQETWDYPCETPVCLSFARVQLGVAVHFDVGGGGGVRPGSP